MSTKKYPSYEEAAVDYVAQFNALLQVPADVKGPITRAAGEVPAQALIERADAIADVSAGMMPLAKGYLESPDFNQREGISAHLLTQAAAELQLASELLEIVQEGETKKPALATRRSVRGADLREAISTLEESMAFPVSQGISPYVKVKRSVPKLTATVDQAKAELQKQATTTTGSISQRVLEFGGSVALNLISKTEWSAVIDGVGLLGKEISEKLDSIKKGVGGLITKAVTVAAKTLINVYDKIMALLGKGLESEIRKQIREWLEKIKKEGKIDLFDSLVSKLYRLDSFKKDLLGWLEKTNADTKMINKTAQEVGTLGDKFAVLVSRMSMVEHVIGLAKLIKIPQVLAILAGIQAGLLGVVVYSGYDYIGYKQVRFLNLTKGVGEVIKENLVMAA
jgi:hypothetical protein